MLLAMTQLGAIRAAANATNAAAATSSVNFSGMLVKLVNSSSIALNNGTLWGSVSAFIGGHPGYADATATFGSPVLNAANVIEAWSNLLSWSDTSTASPQNYAGIVLTDPGSSSVLFAAAFDNPPVVFASALSALDLLIRYNPANPNASLVQIVN